MVAKASAYLGERFPALAGAPLDQAKVCHYGISADDAFTLLVQFSQHTNTKLAEIAPAFVGRVRERGPAHPQQCRVVTEVLEGLLTAGLLYAVLTIRQP